MQDFRKLAVWEKAHQLALDIYRVTKKFPKDELYGLTSQMRRAAVSIPANIAEGRGAETDAGFRRYLCVALASGFELEYHGLLARDLGYLPPTDHEHVAASVSEIRRMLASFITTLKAR